MRSVLRRSTPGPVQEAETRTQAARILGLLDLATQPGESLDSAASKRIGYETPQRSLRFPYGFLFSLK